MLSESHDGKLKCGNVVRLALTYVVSKDAIYRIPKQIRQNGDARHKRTKDCRQKIFEIDIEKVFDVPLNKHNMYRALGHDIGVNKNILLNYKNKGFCDDIQVD